MEKLDLKKVYKNIYKPKGIEIIEVPDLRYISLDGIGNPNSELFTKNIEALYTVAYTISMSYKGGFVIEDFINFVVPPLEGYWSTVTESDYDGNKDNLKWKIMLLIPNFITEGVLETAKKLAFKKKGNKFIKDIAIVNYNKRQACLYTHIGSYDDESISFSKMLEYVNSNGYKRVDPNHREIYLSDFRKTEKEKLKTVLEFTVVKE